VFTVVHCAHRTAPVEALNVDFTVTSPPLGKGCQLIEKACGGTTGAIDRSNKLLLCATMLQMAAESIPKSKLVFSTLSAKLAVNPRPQAGAAPMLLPFRPAIHSPLTPEPDAIPLGVVRDDGKAYSMIAPPVVMRAILFALYSVNHSAPSGPVRMFQGELWAVGTGYPVTAPAVVMRPIALPACSVKPKGGDFYGTTSAGGLHNDGTVFKITPSGVLATLYSFCSQRECADGSTPTAGLVQAPDGDFYGTTSSGGAHSDGTVFKITAGGALKAI
jgi:uncharacterized repeat protein (TIGR03803 family)